jgi:hypothetical protein
VQPLAGKGVVSRYEPPKVELYVTYVFVPEPW